MNIIYADYNIHHNSIDICTYAGYILRIDCAKAEEGLKTTPNSMCALNALAIDNPLYARLYTYPRSKVVKIIQPSALLFPTLVGTISTMVPVTEPKLLLR